MKFIFNLPSYKNMKTGQIPLMAPTIPTPPVKLPATFTPTYTGTENLSNETLQKIATQCRLDALEMIYTAESGHPGSSFSCLDILTYLYCSHLRHCATQPTWSDRDRFVLSKGHAAPALYAILMETGYIEKALKPTLRQVHSKLQGHPASQYISGVDVSTGSLGQGLSCAVGMALGLRLDDSPARVWTILGDGECQEGNTWEAVMSAAHHKVNNLTAIVDRNRLQIDGSTEAVKGLGNMAKKFESFEWNVLEIDATSFDEIRSACQKADELAKTTDKPTVIIANTVKGRGVSFMENQAGWHGKAPNKAEYEAAVAELQALLK